MKKLSKLFKLILYTLVVVSLYEEIFANGDLRLGAFMFFTFQINTLLALDLFLALVIPRHYRAKSLFRGTILVSIIMTGIIYNFVLYNIFQDWGTVGYTFPRTVLHVVTPIGYLIDWLLFDKHGYMKWKDLRVWLAYPLVYCFAAIFVAIYFNFYIYSFFSISYGYTPLIIWISIFLCAFIFVSLLVVSADKKLKLSS